ncbi:hypothetical protein HAV15_005584 [Penicillium sp. str. |nr:hypothetical protein HAV15_005584 [Penicillium sp. str. \
MPHGPLTRRKAPPRGRACPTTSAATRLQTSSSKALSEFNTAASTTSEPVTALITGHSSYSSTLSRIEQ